mmetsp:Transcript_13541/g.36202  ORF Transcript_13541/g.36202 Transcript_13541/m.36202 type:complete len:210 (-) Transcript_13541:168-797(-)
MNLAHECICCSPECELVPPFLHLFHGLEPALKLSWLEENAKLPRVVPHELARRLAHVLVVLLCAKELIRQRTELTVPVIPHAGLLELAEGESLAQKVHTRDDVILPRICLLHRKLDLLRAHRAAASRERHSGARFGILLLFGDACGLQAPLENDARLEHGRRKFFRLCLFSKHPRNALVLFGALGDPWAVARKARWCEWRGRPCHRRRG